MKKFFLWFALCIGLSQPASANMMPPILFDSPPSAAVGYIGDVVSLTAYYSLRAYTAAQAAAATQNVTDLVRNDGATCTAKIGTNGYIDTTVGTPCNGATQTVTAWNAAGASHSCTGSISGTTFSRTGGFNCVVGDQLSGTGVTAGTYLVTIGTCNIGVGGTCIVSVSQTVAATTMTGSPYGMRLNKWYDLTNGNACGGATCDMSNFDGQGAPFLFLSGCGDAYPCAVFRAQIYRIRSANNFTPSNSSLSISVVGNRAQGTATEGLFRVTSANKIEATTANNWRLGGTGGSITSSASDAVWHAASGIILTGTGNGVLNIDGSETTGTTGTAGNTPGTPGIINTSGPTIWIREAGFQDNVAWSGATRTAICQQQHIAWGISGSC